MKLAVVLASASFAVFGACLTLPGTLLPLLVAEFDMRLVEAGSMLAFQPAAYLFAVLAAAPMLRWAGMRIALSASLLCFAAGTAGIGFASSWPAAAAMLFLGGLGFGIMEVAINTLLIDMGGARASNLLNFTHLFFGAGSFIAPGLTASAVAAGSAWWLPFWVGGAAAAAVGIGWALLRTAGQEGAGTSAQRSPAPLRLGLIVLLALALGVYVGAETGTGSWLTKYMIGERGVGLAYAGNVLSLYWLGLTAGRLVLSVSSHRVAGEVLLPALSLLSLAGLGGALITSSPLGATIGFTIAGAGLSGIFPGILALGGRLYPQDVARVTSYLVAGAGVGGIAIPWLMSAIADAAGLTAGMAFYAAMCALMAALTVGALRAARQDGPA